MKMLGFASSKLGCVFTVGSARRLAYGKPLDCSMGMYESREQPWNDVRRPSIDVQLLNGLIINLFGTVYIGVV